MAARQITRKIKKISTRILGALLVLCVGGLRTNADNYTGPSGNWSTPENWGLGAVPAGGLGGEDGNINRNDDVTITVNSAVPAIDQTQLQNTTTETPNTITLMIEEGADLQINAYSRLGRTGNANGDTSQIIMTGGSFSQVADDFHFGWDPPSPSTIYFEISGGTFDVFDELRIGQNDLGNANPADPEDIITAPDKLEFHVNGSAGTVRVGELHFESNPEAVDPWQSTLRFSLDEGGAGTFIVDGEGDSFLGRITWEDSVRLAFNVKNADVPSDITLISSLTPSTGTLLNSDGVAINPGDQVSAGLFGGMEYFYDVYFDSTSDGFGIPGLYLTNLQTVEAEGLPGDYNEDNVVNAADYVAWRNNFGNAEALPNDDTAGVDNDDYDRWRNNYGMMLGSGQSASGTAAAVPEPASLILAICAMATLAMRQRLPHRLFFRT